MFYICQHQFLAKVRGVFVDRINSSAKPLLWAKYLDAKDGQRQVDKVGLSLGLTQLPQVASSVPNWAQRSLNQR